LDFLNHGGIKGNHTHAAKLLEISHRALLYKIKEYGIIENSWRKLDFWNHGGI